MMFVILITVLSGGNCLPGDVETQYRSQCACQCAYNVLYYCRNFDKPGSCPKPVRTNTAIPTPTITPFRTPISTPVPTLIPTPVKTPIPTFSPSNLLPTGTRPYYCFVSCKRQVLPKTWFLLILGLI
jgi:hypothetical protein